MARKSNDYHLDQLRDAVIANPDRRAGWFARLFNTDDKTIQRQLPQLEERGDLLSEDENGRLRFWRKRC